VKPGRKYELRKRAWRAAAGLLDIAVYDLDLSADLDKDEEEWAREFIRTKVVAWLEKRGKP
jgi:hypothetical protein